MANATDKQVVDYSTKRITHSLIEELKKAMKSVDGFGSVELYIHDNNVTQITVRTIKKTKA